MLQQLQHLELNEVKLRVEEVSGFHVEFTEATLRFEGTRNEFRLGE